MKKIILMAFICLSANFAQEIETNFEFGVESNFESSYDSRESNIDLRESKGESNIEELVDLAKKGAKNAFFIGFGIDFSPFTYSKDLQQEISRVNNNQHTQTITRTTLSTLHIKGSGAGGNILIGYQGFLVPFSEIAQIGLRAFLDVGALKLNFSDNGTKITPTLLKYALNVDLILHFMDANLGIFGGVRLGGASFFGRDIDALDRNLREYNGNFPKGAFDLGINVGLRANIAPHSALEIAFNKPLFKFDYKGTRTNKNGSTNTYTRLLGAFKQEWSVGLRYIWAFD